MTTTAGLTGNAVVKFPSPPAGQVSVVATLPFQVTSPFFTVGIVVANETSGPLGILVDAKAYTGQGQPFGDSNEAGIEPEVVPPGHIGFGSFDVDNDGPGVIGKPTFQFHTFQSKTGYADSHNVSLPVGQFRQSRDRITGLATNDSGHTVGPGEVQGLCVSTGGAPLSLLYARLPDTATAPRGRIPFTMNVDGSCPTFLLADASTVIRK